MANKIINWISNKLANQKKEHLSEHLLLLAIFFIPLILIVSFSLFTAYNQLTKLALERRESITTLTAKTVDENLSHMADLGVSFASRVVFRKLIEEGKWQEAVKLQETVPRDFPIIERIVLIDPSGKGKADILNDPNIIDMDFSYRDWYRGVSKEWKPYVSEVFKAAVAPFYNSIVISTPIKKESGEILGILNMQIKLDSLFKWTEDIKIGQTGFIYVVDQNNHIVIHPKFPSQGEIVDFSNTPGVKELRKTGHGVIIAFNPIEKEERLSAFETISKYGWGVIIQEPTAGAFASRNREVLKLSIIYVFIGLFCVFLHYLFIKLLHVTNTYRQKERTLLNSIGDGIIAIDRYWNITMWNKAATVITGWNEEEVMGKPLRQYLKLIREKDRQENITFIEKAIVYGQVGFLENNTVLIRKDGSEIPAGDSAAPIFDYNNIVIGAIIVFRDISKEKEASAFKSDFAYASHQLNTPITKTLWLLESARDESDSFKIKEKIKTAYRAALSIQKLSHQLLAVSEIDQKIIIPKWEEIKLTEIFDNILKECETVVKMSGCSQIEIEPISATTGIKTDPKLMKGAILEIIDNAIKYNKANGKINIKVSIEMDNLLVTISDTGIGIPADQQSLVFIKFFRGNNFDTTEIVGAGLGLFTAREYIKLLKGKIWFNSEIEKGSTFFVQIPLK